MKTLLTLSALVALTFVTGCVSVKRDEPATTRSTTVVPAVGVTTQTTTY